MSQHEKQQRSAAQCLAAISRRDRVASPRGQLLTQRAPLSSLNAKVVQRHAPRLAQRLLEASAT